MRPAGAFRVGAVIQGGPTFTTAHNEFFPVARFREPWVRKRIIAAGVGTPVGNTAIVTADTNAMKTVNASDSLQPATVYAKVLGYGVGNSRCFPVGSPQLMLAERNMDANCNVIDGDERRRVWMGRAKWRGHQLQSDAALRRNGLDLHRDRDALCIFRQ